MSKAKNTPERKTYSYRLRHAHSKSEEAVELADDIQALADWLKNDVLSAVGPNLENRKKLFALVIEELKNRETLSAKIRSVRRYLENQQEDLLRFVKRLDCQLNSLAEEWCVDPYLIQELFELQRVSPLSHSHWQRAAILRQALRGRFDPIETEIKTLIEETIRASSVVENLNSHLRNYFFLRKKLGNDYLELLQFFLNHRRFVRSRRPERIGKSPAELLVGEEHQHWLELLGFRLFKREIEPQAESRLAA